MSLNEFWLQTLNGLTFAALLFLVSSGFTLIFGLMRIVNLAQGSLYLLGGYIGLSVLRGTGSYWLALLAGALAVGAIGLVIERGVLRSVRGGPMSEILLTVGCRSSWPTSRWRSGAATRSRSTRPPRSTAAQSCSA